jgi:hypothetical protein
VLHDLELCFSNHRDLAKSLTFCVCDLVGVGIPSCTQRNLLHM